MPRLRGLLLLVLLGTACTQGTAILLVVDGDLAPGDEVDELVVSVWEGGAQVSAESHVVEGWDRWPLSYRLVSSSSADSNVEIRVEGRLDGLAVVEAARAAAFDAGREVEVRICLWRECVGQGTARCLEGRCDESPDGDAGPDADGDADTGPCDDLEDVRAEAIGADHVVVDLRPCDVMVTYVHEDGYFAQVSRAGPGIWVDEGVDWVADVAVGDTVRLHVTEVNEADGNAQVTAHGPVEVVARGGDLSTMVQDLSAGRLVSEPYEAELVKIVGARVDDVIGSSLRVSYGSTAGAAVDVSDPSAFCLGATFTVTAPVVEHVEEPFHRVRSFAASDVTSLDPTGCGGAFTSPFNSDIVGGCDSERADVFSFVAGDGTMVGVSVDTVSVDTASDLAAELFTNLDAPFSSTLDGGDDEMACTFPPPEFLCPSFAHPVAAGEGGTLYLLVWAIGSCADPARYEYRLSVTVDGVHALLTLVEDDADTTGWI
jgi:hypothetical protein